ncbi:MAG: carboxypeptidase-like regulatory domain-containing protein, partial [Flavobacteriaceae bacterium]
MKLKFLILTLVFAVSSGSLAQTQITGTVVDDQNVPLPGANVLEKGTTNGVVTDFDGNFSISVSGNDGTII